MTAQQEMSVDDTVTLESRFLYQNSVTGDVSTTPLTIRQLCRLLCPGGSAALPQHLHGDTQLIALNGDGSYSSQGWRQAKMVPVLCQALAQWYYEQPPVDGASSSATQGPVSCRELAKLLHETTIDVQTRVYSQTAGNTWQSIVALPHLRLALDALEPPPTLASTNSHKGDSQQPLSDDDKQIQDELEAFLSSTARMGPAHQQEDDDEDDGEAYESDGGTRYIKDPRTGSWIHEALAPKVEPKKRKEQVITPATSTASQPKKKKPKFSSRNARCWVYITGLPPDTNEDELQSAFTRAGIIDLDPETQRPKIKLYRHKEGTKAGACKGDASICYARPESVHLAMTLLDEAPFRPQVSVKEWILHVEQAKFEQRGDNFDNSRGRISNAKRKVAKLAAIQAMDWDEGEFNGRLTGGRKGLRIVVLKHLFRPSQITKDEEWTKLEEDIRAACEKHGEVEKITVFSKHVQGVAIIKYAQPGAASDAVKELNGQPWKDVGEIDASFWDGVTDYTFREDEKEQKEMEKRHDEFGAWLDSQEVPDELKLRTED